MARIVGVLCLILCSTPSLGQQFLQSGTSHLTSQQVAQQLHVELRALLGHGDSGSFARLDKLQAQIRPMYAAVAKGADGNLDNGAARYILHRYFVQQHGWHVRGLEATGAEKWGDAASTTMLEDRIPSYVLQLFQQQRGGGTGLRELAVLAATLEDVVHSEAIELLSKAYAAQSLSVDQKLPSDAEERIVATYLLFHIMPNPKYASLSTDRLNQVLQRAPKFYTGWLDTVMFVQDLQGSMAYMERPQLNPFLGMASQQREFNAIVGLVEGIGENYGQYQNLECRGMKNTLLDLTDGTGRVPLSKFYQAAFENRSQHFSESPEYLRHLGVLDETNPRHPSVIVTNYMYARANCLASSSLYSICCIDECEGLLASLEREIANPVAHPDKILELVSVMPSDTVSAPRNISVSLQRRLGDIAERHGGSIPLHSRLFAQWMHHVFPNECPYPHTSGSLASPLTPAEWLHSEPDAKRRLKASKEEMQSFIAIAMNSTASDFDDVVAEPAPMPWTEEEELVVSIPVHNWGQARVWLRLFALVFALVSAAVGLLRMLVRSPPFASSSKSDKAKPLTDKAKPLTAPSRVAKADHLHWV